MPGPTVILQKLIDEDIDPILVHGPILESALTEETLDACLTSPQSTIGISAAYTVKGRLTVLAIANATNVLVMQFQPNYPEHKSVRKLLEERLLCRETGEIFAFELAPLVLALFKDHGLRVTNAVDIQSGCHTGPKREPLEAIGNALRDQCDINAKSIRVVFDPENTIWERDNWLADIAQRAWISHYLSQINVMEHEFQEVKRVNTTQFTDEQLNQLAAPVKDSRRLDQMKPGRATHEVVSAIGNQNGVVTAQQKKFAGRMRRSDSQHVKLHVQGDRGKFTVPSVLVNASGRPVELLSENVNLEGKTIIGIENIGREGPTNAELKGAGLLLKTLQEKGGILNNPWVQYLFHGEIKWPGGFFFADATPTLDAEREDPNRYLLNTSQALAVDHMLTRSADKCVTVIQGPPGTGKTSVIAAFVKAALRNGQQGIWLVAQSNVAVKNIAEKLTSSGFHDWRLLVSQDFHFDWHEHLYIKLSSENVIRSDAFHSGHTKRLLGGAQVILCTLSMLSSSRLQKARFSSFVPINTLVVDEASQIQVHDYLPALNDYVRSIRKICFIGDDKQLPPHGADQISDLKSIFDKSHLREGVLFLDTQYRMPPQIGDYISGAVYDSQLQSNPLHPITANIAACHFIDVSQGREERLNPDDKSWANTAEREAVLQIAQKFEAEARSFRIITPYDAQRNALEEEMKQNGLDWHDKCFNVDSFQGNEDDYIIISVVRSRQLGFLQDLRRTNVMLTRCKKGMIICSSRAFLSRIAADTLVGKLAAQVGDAGWVVLKDLETADL